jgi:hypothetical protein
MRRRLHRKKMSGSQKGINATAFFPCQQGSRVRLPSFFEGGAGGGSFNPFHSNHTSV